MKKLSLLLALAAAPAFAQDYTLGDLTLMHPVSYPSAGMTGAGYLDITNTGDTDDRLLSAAADYPRVELHLSEMGDDGVMRMNRQDFIPIPAGETVTLQPGGLHVMFMGVEGGFKLGQEIPVTLTFESAGEIDVIFTVEERPAAEGGMDHGAMDMDK